jgi:predicted nuclease with TOPRIM domain
MKLFISWSKPRSREVANFLKPWLKKVLQEIDPWVSDNDVSRGGHLPDELRKGLEGARFAVICMTVENTQESWLAFEAGAIAHGVGDTARVCPFFIDKALSSADLPSPMANMVYAKSYIKEEVRQLLHSINNSLEPERRLPEGALDMIFDSKWEELNDKLKPIRDAAPSIPITAQQLVEHYQQLVDEFDHIRRSFEVQRRVLSNELHPLVIETVLNYAQGDNEYDLEGIIDKVYERVERVRNEFNFDTRLIGNVRDFLNKRFAREDLKKIIDSKLKPILERGFNSDNKVVELKERIDEISQRAELEGINVFYNLYRVVAEELTQKIVAQKT